MKQRCYNERNSNFKHYGAKGITVCDEWLGKDGAKNFYDWSMSHGYSDNYSIDRIDSRQGYSPFNCVWTDCNLPNETVEQYYAKLLRILYYSPTFELEYAYRHIQSCDDPATKAMLMGAYKREKKRRAK